MRPLRTISAFALLTVMLSGGRLVAADAKPGPVPDAPKGWSKKEDEAGNTVYRPDKLAAGEDMQVTIMPGEADDGDLRKWFDDKVKLLQAGKTPVRTTDPHASQVQGVSAIMQAIVCKDDDAAAGVKGAKNRFLFYTYLAAHPAGRAEMIVMSATSNDLLKKYGADYKALASAWAAVRVADKPAEK